MRRIFNGENADCFGTVGAYQVCDASQQLSIYSSLFLLTTQSLVSRILAPGMSNFVNASVRHLLRRFQIRPSHTPQILHSVRASSEANSVSIADENELSVPVDQLF
jgi:hypothetical protein